MALHKEHLPEPLPAEPLALVADWLSQAARANVQPNANAMVLATVDARGAPAARVVLCKEIRVDAGYITFFTNYLSLKGAELSANTRAAEGCRAASGNASVSRSNSERALTGFTSQPSKPLTALPPKARRSNGENRTRLFGAPAARACNARISAITC